MNINEFPQQVNQVISIAETILQGQILGIYLYGSATMNGLRPDSDIDILIITKQELSNSIRADLTKQLLKISGSVGCIEKRPLEVTIINQSDIVPLQFPPKCQYMYGEWLRGEMEAGEYPQACNDPDIMILLWQARKNSITLKGAESKELIPAIPFHEIKKAIRFSLPGLISSFKGDERNVLLTLSRMWFTLVTEEITTKDVAAKWVILKLPERFPPLLTTAKEAYLGNLSDEWETVEKEAMALVEYMKKHLQTRIKQEEVKIHYHQQAIARMQLATKDMQMAEQYGGKCTWKNFPVAYQLGVCDSLHASLQKWFSLSSETGGLDMTYFYTEFSIKEGQMQEQGTKLFLYQEVGPFISSDFHLEQYPQTAPVPCIYTILESENIYPDEETACQMVRWGKEQGAEPTGVLYSNNMTSFLGEDSNIYFLELYMPVK